jgi:hypothetical protein
MRKAPSGAFFLVRADLRSNLPGISLPRGRSEGQEPASDPSKKKAGIDAGPSAGFPSRFAYFMEPMYTTSAFMSSSVSDRVCFIIFSSERDAEPSL